MPTATVLQPARPRLWRYTVEAYDRMARAGVFRRRRVELVEGKVIWMPAQYEPHIAGVSRAARTVSRAFGAGHWVRQQNPIRLGKRSKPEPDVAVVAGTDADYVDYGTPDHPLLVIEVSDSTLRFDRGRKAAMYARHGVADYWILNIVDRQLEVHREPIADPAHRFKFRYASVTILKGDDTIAPLAAKGAFVRVAEMMPPVAQKPAAAVRRARKPR